MKLGRRDPKDTPPIDWLMAAILERMRVYHYSLKDLAGVAYVGYDTMRQYATRSPWTWPKDTREAVCKALGIRPIQSVYGAPEEDCRG